MRKYSAKIILVIGTDTALSVHIVQTYPDLPAEMACVTWESAGPALYGVFVPLSNAATSVSEPYSCNQSAEEGRIFDTNNYPYYKIQGTDDAGRGKECISDLRRTGESVLA